MDKLEVNLDEIHGEGYEVIEKRQVWLYRKYITSTWNASSAISVAMADGDEYWNTPWTLMEDGPLTSQISAHRILPEEGYD